MLNPSLASAWFLGGFLRVWGGEPDSAIEHFSRAMRLSPLDPEMYRMQAGMALAHLFAGRFDAASSWAEKAFRHLPSFLMVVSIIAPSHGLAPDRTKRGERSIICASSTPRSASPVLRTGFRSIGRNISPYLPTACEKRGCRIDGSPLRHAPGAMLPYAFKDGARAGADRLSRGPSPAPCRYYKKRCGIELSNWTASPS